jgi:hypothetical protein
MRIGHGSQQAVAGLRPRFGSLQAVHARRLEQPQHVIETLKEWRSTIVERVGQPVRRRRRGPQRKALPVRRIGADGAAVGDVEELVRVILGVRCVASVPDDLGPRALST